MTLQNEEGGPLVHVLVKITRVQATYPAQAYGYTDSMGKVNGLVPDNENLLLEVLDPCNNVIHSRNIGPYSQNTNLGVITLTNTGTSLLTVTGQVRNCTGGIVTNGYAVVSIDNNSRYVNVNSTGQFSMSFIRCPGSANTITVTGVDNSTQQQGTVNNIPVTMPSTNAGTITACGVSTTQYINYTLDGTSYNLSSANPSDSLFGYTRLLNTGVAYATDLGGFSSSSINDIHIEFPSASMVAGTYQAGYVRAHQAGGGTPVNPFNVIVTNFPTTAGSFYEGSFSGQFRDSVGVGNLHSLSGTFRIRK
jgi:hypothetical protein